jgi:hypothetical protein
MEHAYKWILKWGGGLAFIIIIVWPCLALPAGVFSKGYFTFWVILSIIWGLVSPLYLHSTAVSLCTMPRSATACAQTLKNDNLVASHWCRATLLQTQQ